MGDAESGWQQGGESRVLMSAFTLSSQPESGLFAQSSVQAWLRKELGGIQASGWFHVQNSDAAGLREHLPPAVASSAGCWYRILLASGRLARGRRVAGSCWDFKVPQVVHRFLLSS